LLGKKEKGVLHLGHYVSIEEESMLYGFCPADTNNEPSPAKKCHSEKEEIGH
jgi:hypothetical protein